jgi:hypothetical protein
MTRMSSCLLSQLEVFNHSIIRKQNFGGSGAEGGKAFKIAIGQGPW